MKILLNFEIMISYIPQLTIFISLEKFSIVGLFLNAIPRIFPSSLNSVWI